MTRLLVHTAFLIGFLSFGLGLAACGEEGGGETKDTYDTGAADADGDGFSTAGGDCDDTDAEVNPDAFEVCDGVDNDCDGETDEGLTETLYVDADGDGFGDPDQPQEGCEEGDGLVADDTDCDDTDADVNPGAVEVCNEFDDNCNGAVDEGTSKETWYLDSDGDGYGSPDETLEACEQPSGYVDNAEDCDDSSADASPEGSEVCDGLDNDCNGTVDGSDAADASTWYVDADGDGYGLLDETTTDCDPPDGYAAEVGDCDDDDYTVHPDATETCNDIDDDCDDLVDEDDPDLEGATWYEDADGDGYGDPAAGMVICEEPSGYVEDDTDCDDLDATVYPGAEEVCDSVDSNCDGYDAPLWYIDSDGDGYGDDATATDACTQPTGYVSEGGDCDDTDDTLHPGAEEDGGTGTGMGDGIDNDCDGLVDDGTYYGSGQDGDLNVTSTSDITDLGAVWVAVTALSTASAEVEDASDLLADDMVILVNMEGSSSAHGNVANWEILQIEAIDSDEVTFTTSIQEIYGESYNSDLTDQSVALYRLPEFGDVDISGTLTGPAYADGTGGFVAFVANGTVTISGEVTASGLGYAGGEENTEYDTSGQAGQSISGLGDKNYYDNEGGGGGGGLDVESCDNCEGTGAGGGHGTSGEDGEQSNPDNGYGGTGGDSYGRRSLTDLTLGSGGGAGALDAEEEGGVGGAGGAGGGVVLLRAPVLEVTGTVSADGADGDLGCNKTYNDCGTGADSEAEPGGGGAGGSIYLASDEMSLSSGDLQAIGGSGQPSGNSHGAYSGAGGDGRIRLDFTTLDGYEYDTEDAETAAADAGEPDPGYLGEVE